LAQQPNKKSRSRFAPSPTGYLHLGHIASAVYVWGIGRKLGAEIILRMEDHDRGRYRREYEEAILKDLEWLGFQPDHGVESLDKPSTYRQSDCLADYQAASEKLKKTGLVYFCDCSRKKINQTSAGELFYDGHCRNRNLDSANAGLRLTIDAEAQESFDDLLLGACTQVPAKQCGDLLLRDRTGNWTYQFGVSVDDYNQDIDLVIRGEDLTASTGRQIYLARKIGRNLPARFCHHPLISDLEGRKLSKRDFAEPVAKHREDGANPGDLLGAAAQLVGLLSRPKRLQVSDMTELFGDLDPSCHLA